MCTKVNKSLERSFLVIGNSFQTYFQIQIRNTFSVYSLESPPLTSFVTSYSHLSNKRGGWNKRGGVQKLQNQ